MGNRFTSTLLNGISCRLEGPKQPGQSATATGSAALGEAPFPLSFSRVANRDQLAVQLH